MQHPGGRPPEGSQRQPADDDAGPGGLRHGRYRRGESRTPSSRSFSDVASLQYTVDASVYLNSVIIALARAGMQLATSIFVRPGGQLVTLGKYARRSGC